MKVILQHARSLRKNLTDAEHKLWYYLRKQNLNGLRFRRQVPLGIYIVDFLCHEKDLIIEVDGGGHNEEETIEYDKVRTLWLESQGYRVERFWNNEILRDIDNVLEKIFNICE